MGPASAAPVGPAGPAEFDDESGAIDGTVTDEEIRPIAGATIGIIGAKDADGATKDMLSVTDAEGKYSLSHVPPGDHVIAFQALGYEAFSKRVTVVAGQVLRVDAVLTSLAVDGPYKLEYIVKGRMGYGAAWKLTPTCIYEPLTTVNPLLKTCGGIRSGDSTNGEIGLGNVKSNAGTGSVEDNWQTMLIELVWTQQTPQFGRSLQLDVLFPNITRGANGAANQADPRYFQNPDYASPIVLRIDRPTMDERKIPADDQYGDVRARVFTASADLGTWQSAPDVGLMLEQSFTYYVAIGYDEPLEPNYSGLPPS